MYQPKVNLASKLMYIALIKPTLEANTLTLIDKAWDFLYHSFTRVQKILNLHGVLTCFDIPRPISFSTGVHGSGISGFGCQWLVAGAKAEFALPIASRVAQTASCWYPPHSLMQEFASHCFAAFPGWLRWKTTAWKMIRGVRTKPLERVYAQHTILIHFYCLRAFASMEMRVSRLRFVFHMESKSLRLPPQASSSSKLWAKDSQNDVLG